MNTKLMQDSANLVKALSQKYIKFGFYSENLTMQAIQFDPKSKKLHLLKKDLPKIIADNEILVQVHYAGICGTDLHIIAGEFPCKETPLVLGHEFSGIVSKIGKNVRHVQVGDKVVVDPNKGCMICSACRKGNPHFCKTGGLQSTIGIFIDGGWEQYCLVPDIQIHKIPDNITLKQAALCEPISCISHAWDRISPVPLGTRILILGAGIIGNLFTSLLHLQGHKKVTVSEPSKERLKLTKNLETGFDLVTPDILTERRMKNDSYLFDLLIDCSGNAKAIENAFNFMDFGGKMCIFGVANPTAKMCITPFEMFKKELTIIGVVINPFSFPKAINIVESMGDRYLSYEKLGVQTFALEEYETAIQCLKNGEISKATFKIH